MLGCFATLVLVVDEVCRLNIEQRIPYYPDARVVSVDYDFIRLRALGVSRVVLSSPEDPETVRQFYRDNTIRLMQAEESRGLAGTDWNVQPDEDGGGSIIILSSVCGS